jgi:hypothetical protein
VAKKLPEPYQEALQLLAGLEIDLGDIAEEIERWVPDLGKMDRPNGEVFAGMVRRSHERIKKIADVLEPLRVEE